MAGLQREGLTREDKEQVLEALIQDHLLYHEALRRRLYLHEDIQRVLAEAVEKKEVGAKVSARDIDDSEAQAYFEGESVAVRGASTDPTATNHVGGCRGRIRNPYIACGSL